MQHRPGAAAPPLLLPRPEIRHEDPSGHVSCDLQEGQREVHFHLHVIGTVFQVLSCILRAVFNKNNQKPLK